MGPCLGPGYSVVLQRLSSALALLVSRVLADHHDSAVATDHLALVTDRLDARVDLHVSKLFHVDPPALVESAGDADG